MKTTLLVIAIICSLTFSERSLLYSLHPNKLGRIVTGIDLNTKISQDVITQILQDVTKHKLLVFKNQGIVSPERQLEISKWFGSVTSKFYSHPKSPNRDIFRISNDPTEGCGKVGTTGWHIDGSWEEKPFSHAIYHIIESPKEGATIFADLYQVIDGLDKKKRDYWEKLYMVASLSVFQKTNISSFQSVSRENDEVIHPLIYSHPLIGEPTLSLHSGMTVQYIYDYGGPNEVRLNKNESELIRQGINQEFSKNNGNVQYWHHWESGDFIMTDNLALGHMGSPQTQLSREEVGLRVMHRVTIAGQHIPQKGPQKCIILKNSSCQKILQL